MAKGDITILDMQLDMANGAALDRVNAAFELGQVRRWFEPRWLSGGYRERVREALRSKWATTLPNLPASA